MNKTQKYILNPIYSLLPDGNRVKLISKDSEGGVMTFIHPVQALLLSNFTGELTFHEIVESRFEIFQCKERDLYKVIEPFIENKNYIKVCYDGNNFVFPRDILIKNEYNLIRNDINYKNLYIKPPYDFNTKRLSLPKTILFVVNTVCGTDCIYCYANKTHKYNPIKTGKILDIIEEAQQLGIREFDLSGGEVFLHKDWYLIIKKLVDCGYMPYISTKVAIDKQTIDKLSTTGLKELQISLDSINPILLKNSLKVSEFYAERIKETIKYLDKKGFNIFIKSTLTKETCSIENIKELLSFLSSFNNIKKYTITPVGYTHNKPLQDYGNFKPTLQQVNSVVNEFKKKEKFFNFTINWDMGAIHYQNHYKNALFFKKRSLCSGNITGIVILPDGKVTICEELYWNENFIIGNLNTDTIIDIWQSNKATSLARLSQDIFPYDSPCKVCSDFSECRYKRGVCWKEVIAFYGQEHWLYPDPRCPRAPLYNNDKNQLMYEMS
ncbi:MAG: radical SAM protein [Candidatus Symbiothrix sp.]|jgi:radical SAM protein with 4Fe4S-binding SPASM domain|nr:radical SAM protein [Candidatus Symbiothrix sp.]